MPVCQYFLQGRCSFGDRCRNDHPQNQPSGFGQPSSLGGGGGGGAAASGSRFSAFGGAGGAGGGFGQKSAFASQPSSSSSGGGFGQKSAFGSQTGGGAFGTPAKAAPKREGPDAEFLGKMLANRPLWQFSVFGVSGDKPNLLSGTDISLEELQLDFVMAQRSGTLPACQQKYDQLAREMNAKIDYIAANPDLCLQTWWAQIGEDPPKPTTPGQPQPTSAFGQPQPTSAFGQPQPTSAFGQPKPTSAFGQPKPAFGQTTSAFGQPKPAFGQALAGPSGFGSGSGSAFGRPQATPGFGQSPTASAFGKQASAFGGGGGGATAGFGQVAQIKVDASAAEPTEKLSAQDIECYRTGQFVLGAIPELPPTSEFR
ncbi:Nucleoporin-like protein 2 [Coemansia spiralis]|nr:Nucleoporin-like protein 2 [Coemansia spiralis]